MALFFRQTWTLTVKNLLVVLVRPLFTTVLRALVLPVVFVAFISYARNLFIQPATYGIGDPTPLRSFADALDHIGGGRNRLIFIHNGFEGGQIEQVINQVAEPARLNKNEVHIVSSKAEMRELCQTLLHGMSKCITTTVFYSSPSKGPYQTWNYSIRTNAVLGAGIEVNKHNNNQQIYLLPFQRSIDWAIARANTSIDAGSLPQEILEYPYTSMTDDERRDKIRTRYMGVIIDIIAVAIFIGMIIAGVILKYGVYSKTSAGITVVYHILAGLALSSFSVFGASFFKKAQLSGISVVIACLILGVIAQMIPATTN